MRVYNYCFGDPDAVSGVVIAASYDDARAHVREGFPDAQDIRVFPQLTIRTIKRAINMGAISFYPDADDSPRFRVGNIISLSFGGATGELEGLDEYLKNSDMDDICVEILDAILSTLSFDADGNPIGAYPACVEFIESYMNIKPGDITKTPDGQFIYRDYVISPCRNAFNERTSYWISKRGCTIAVYCFSDTYGDPETEVRNGITGFISMFEDRMAQIK